MQCFCLINEQKFDQVSHHKGIDPAKNGVLDSCTAKAITYFSFISTSDLSVVHILLSQFVFVVIPVPWLPQQKHSAPAARVFFVIFTASDNCSISLFIWPLLPHVHVEQFCLHLLTLSYTGSTR